jgi:hypothetical protein
MSDYVTSRLGDQKVTEPPFLQGQALRTSMIDLPKNGMNFSKS